MISAKSRLLSESKVVVAQITMETAIDMSLEDLGWNGKHRYWTVVMNVLSVLTLIQLICESVCLFIS